MATQKQGTRYKLEIMTAFSIRTLYWQEIGVYKTKDEATTKAWAYMTEQAGTPARARITKVPCLEET
jgi:hypothetical protein